MFPEVLGMPGNSAKQNMQDMFPVITMAQ